jgi:hypothetical protein
MKLSPKAYRFVIQAIRDLPDAMAREGVRAWMEAPAGRDLPPGIADLALSALEQFGQSMKQYLGSGHLDEDQRAEVINDLRFIDAIESDLRRDAAHLRQDA